MVAVIRETVLDGEPALDVDTEALTRRRAVAVGGPIAVSAGAIWASESFTITGLIGKDSRSDYRPVGVAPIYRFNPWWSCSRTASKEVAPQRHCSPASRASKNSYAWAWAPGRPAICVVCSRIARARSACWRQVGSSLLKAQVARA